MLDRWLSAAEPLEEALGPAWCSVDLLCRTGLPSYFLLAFALTILAMALITLGPRSRAVEGWQALPADADTANDVLMEIPSPNLASRALKGAAAVGYLLAAAAALGYRWFSPWAYLLIILAYFAGQVIESLRVNRAIAALRRSLPKIGLIVSAHVSLVLFLAWHQHVSFLQWIALACFVVSVYGLIRIRRQLSPVIWIVLAAIIAFTARIGSWQYAIVGDEYRFFFDARAIAAAPRLKAVVAHLFDGTWTYGTHPYVSSLIQAAFMFLLGRDNFGWRFSNIYLSAVSIAFFFQFFKSFFSRRVALVTALLLACSHYLMNFSKIGYNNLQALFVMSLVLWLAGAAVRSKSPFAYTALGVGSSACFYVFPAALYLLPLPILVIWLYAPGPRRDTLRRAGLALGAFLILIFPLIIQADFWESKLTGLFLHSRELVNSSSSFWFHIGSNLLYSFFSFLYIPHESHFVVASYVDPLTAVFVPIGFVLALRQISRSKSALFLALAFLLEALLVGTTHDRPFPTTTRMFLMLPWFFLFAALGIDHMLDAVAGSIRRAPALPMIAGPLMIAVLGLNIYQSTHVFRQRTAGTPGLEALFLRMLQHDARQDPETLKDYLFITAPDWGIDGIVLLQDVYKLPPSPTQLHRVVAQSAELPADALPLIAEDDTVVILQPWMDEPVRLGLEARLAEIGRAPCQVRDIPQKDVRFTFWFTPALKGLCQRANTDE